VVECADKAVEDLMHLEVNLMHLEDRYMHVSAWRSEKACKEYQNAIALSIWTNESTFYANLCHHLIMHVKCHLHQMVFHPAKILMQMDLAGGTLSMEGLKVIHMCKTDSKKYVSNTIICSSADIKCFAVLMLINCQRKFYRMSMDTLTMPMEVVSLFSGSQGT